MTVETLAAAVIDACEAEGVNHMVTGAFAYSLYRIPRSTKGVDIVLSLAAGDPILRVAGRLAPLVEFDQQAQFDTLTWGKRLVGTSREIPLKVELFRYLIQHKAEYYRTLQQVTAEQVWEAWISFMLQGVEETARWTTARMDAGLKESYSSCLVEMTVHRCLRAGHQSKIGGFLISTGGL